MERLVTTIKKLCEESRAVADIAAKDGEELRKQLKDPQQKDIFMKPQRVSVKEIRQMVTFLSEKDVPIGNMNTTHCERFAMFSKLELQKALGVIKEANQSYIDLLLYFGEDMMSSQAFFGMIDQFMERFDQVADRIETEEQASWKHSRRALNKEAKLRVKSASKSAVDGGNFVSSLKKADDVRVSSAECNENENSTTTTNTARLSNTANGTVESVTVPYDEEAVTGDDTSRKSAQLSPGGIREEGVNAIPISTTLDNVDQIQPSTEEPIPTRVRIGTSKPAWKTSNVGASLSSGVLPSLPSTGFTSIADMAATVARKRNVPVESITTAEPIQRVGKMKSGTAVNHRLNSEHIVALKANGKPTFPSVDKKTDSEILQADVRPTQSVNVAALIALRESGRPPDMKSATAVNHRLESEHRIALKDNKKENLPSVASPTVMNIAPMAAEVVRQKKLKQRSEQANKDSQYNRALVEPGDGATTCIVKEHKKDVEARLKRGLVSVEAESIKVKSSSSAIPHTHASYNFINVGSQLAQSTLIVAVNNVAKQKLQKPVGVRKPSKLSLAVAAAAQHRESRFVQ